MISVLPVMSNSIVFLMYCILFLLRIRQISMSAGFQASAMVVVQTHLVDICAGAHGEHRVTHTKEVVAPTL